MRGEHTNISISAASIVEDDDFDIYLCFRRPRLCMSEKERGRGTKEGQRRER